MKTLKFLLACLFFLGYVFLTDANAQKKSEKVNFSATFYCPCAGEVVHYDVVFNYVVNARGEHYNAMCGTLIGQTSGETYRMIDTESYRINGGTVVIVRFINKGIVRMDQFIVNDNREVYWGGCGS